MKRKQNLISISRSSGFQLGPVLTHQESIILRALAGGRSDRQVCNDLGMEPISFLSMLREMRQKIGVSDNVSLVSWAKCQIRDGDQRIDPPAGYGRLG